MDPVCYFMLGRGMSLNEARKSGVNRNAVDSVVSRARWRRHLRLQARLQQWR
jgi:hypothetical protein